jgi:hypothetical protein
MLIGLVLFMLYGWMLQRHRTDLPDLVLMVDDSASMASEDHYDEAGRVERLRERTSEAGLSRISRLNLAKTILLEDDGRLLETLQRRYRLKVYRVAGSARAIDGPAAGEARAAAPSFSQQLRQLEADGETSRLGKGVRDVLETQRGRPTAAVILLTDGVTTEGQTIAETAPYARRKAVPLFLVGLGDPEPPRDIRLSDLLVDEIVFVDDLVNFDFKLTATGYEGKRVAVRLTQEGRSGPPLDEKQVTLAADDQAQNVRLAFRPQEQGDFEYVVEVEPQEGEANLDNNREVREVRVRDESLRALFVRA